MINTSYYSYWWLYGTQTTTQSEISDERIKQNITPIENPISKLMLLKPKQYNLCDDKHYLLKYGLIPQEVEKVLPGFVVDDEEYIANIYCNGIYINKIIASSKNINGLLNINDELKLVLDNKTEDKEFIIEETTYHKRYKRLQKNS